MAYEHSHRRTTASKTWLFSRGRIVIQSSETLRRVKRRLLRLGNTTAPKMLGHYTIGV